MPRGYPLEVKHEFRIDFRTSLGKAQVLGDGSLKVPAFLARTGVQNYTYSDGRKVREHRPADQVFSQDSLDSFKGLALTVQHPVGGRVNPGSWRTVAVGHVGEDVRQEGQLMAASLYVKDEATIKRVLSGELVELSNGYDCTMVPEPGRNDAGEEYDAIQTGIKGNHVALLGAGQGRAGSNVRLYLDSANEELASIAVSTDSCADLKEDMTEAEKKAKAEADAKAAKVEPPAVTPPVVEPPKVDPPAPAPVVEAPAPAPAIVSVPKPEGNIDSKDDLDERVEVVASARRLVGDSYDYKGKTIAQIKAEVVEKLGVKCDGKDAGYIDARFDVLLETSLKQDSSDTALGSFRVACSAPVAKTDAAEAARLAMVNDNVNAWKKPKK